MKNPGTDKALIWFLSASGNLGSRNPPGADLNGGWS
ncbi:hypothetical protein CSAG_04910, partial [Citrobacter portucalensis]